MDRAQCKQEARAASTGLAEGSAVPETGLVLQKQRRRRRQRKLMKSFYLFIPSMEDGKSDSSPSVEGLPVSRYISGVASELLMGRRADGQRAHPATVGWVGGAGGQRKEQVIAGGSEWKHGPRPRWVFSLLQLVGHLQGRGEASC